MWQRRALEVLGELFAGDGVATLFAPRAHMQLWRDVFPWRMWNDLVRWLTAHPKATYALGLLELGIGVWLIHQATQNLPDDDPKLLERFPLP